MPAGGVRGDRHRGSVPGPALGALAGGERGLARGLRRAAGGGQGALRDAGGRDPGIGLGGEGQHDLLAEQQVVGGRSGGVDPARRVGVDAAERAELLEFGAGAIRVEPGLDAVAVLLDGVPR